jgi:hypothetical protein
MTTGKPMGIGLNPIPICAAWDSPSSARIPRVGVEWSQTISKSEMTAAGRRSLGDAQLNILQTVVLSFHERGTQACTKKKMVKPHG